MLQMGLLGDRAPSDDDVICAICHRPIAPNEGRYRTPEGDVHDDCYHRKWGGGREG